MLEIKITLAEPEPLVMPTVVVNQTSDEGAVEKAFRDGIKEGKSQFAAELKEYIFRTYGGDKGIVGATASQITDMIDAMNYG